MTAEAVVKLYQNKISNNVFTQTTFSFVAGPCTVHARLAVTIALALRLLQQRDRNMALTSQAAGCQLICSNRAR